MAFNRVIGGYYINASGVWAEGGKGVDVSVSRSSGTSASSSGSRKSRTRRTSDDDEEDEDYDDEDYDDEDEERDPDHWGTAYSDDGPGFDMIDHENSGPGKNITSTGQDDRPGAAYKTTQESSTFTTPGNNPYRGRDGSFYDDEEAGGSKEDWLDYSSRLYQSQEKNPGDYTGDYGARYDYETHTFTDDDGNTRTIINKERNDRE